MKTKILFAILLGSSLTGCASFYDCYDESTMTVRNRCLARQAWTRWQWCYADMPNHCDFGQGFRDGYVDGIQGVPECQPVLPPRKYWTVHYQNADGHCKVNAWYNGYSHGHLAAIQDGYGQANRIPLSPTARQNQLQYEQARLMRKRFQMGRDNGTIRAPYFGSGDGIRTQRQPGVDTEDDPDLDTLRDALGGGAGAAGASDGDGESGGTGKRPYEDTPAPLGDDSAGITPPATFGVVPPVNPDGTIPQANIPPSQFTRPVRTGAVPGK